MHKLKLAVGSLDIVVELFDTPTADALWDAAPFSAKTMTWGEEIYFATPVSCPREKNARAVIE